MSGYFRHASRRRAMVSLPPCSLQIPEDRGYLILPAGVFSETDGVVSAALESTHLDRRGVAGRGGKRFLQNLIDSAELTLDSPVMRLALRSDVLSTVSNYLGMPPLLTAVSVFLSEVAEPELRSSQLFHCDGDDVRQVKVFIYCTEVSNASGPLTLLDAGASRKVMEATKYRFRQRLSDAQVQSVVGARVEVPVLGPRGTIALVDTSRCLHYGSRVASDAPPRLVTMIQYQTPYSFMLPERALPYAHLAGPGQSVLQRLVLGG